MYKGMNTILQEKVKRLERLIAEVDKELDELNASARTIDKKILQYQYAKTKLQQTLKQTLEQLTIPTLN
jgi:prefoldin subunit 5